MAAAASIWHNSQASKRDVRSSGYLLTCVGNEGTISSRETRHLFQTTRFTNCLPKGPVHFEIFYEPWWSGVLNLPFVFCRPGWQPWWAGCCIVATSPCRYGSGRWWHPPTSQHLPPRILKMKTRHDDGYEDSIGYITNIHLHCISV